MSREENVKIFNDTLDFIKKNKILSESVEKSISGTKFYPARQILAPTNNCFLNNVFVTKNRTFEAAMKLAKNYPGKKIAVLNFASASTPGGGVKNGASAQEEALCRISTLYPVLTTKDLWEKFYAPHRAECNPLHNDDIIYTPDIVICKTDTISANKLYDSNFVKVDVITCAAPNLREVPSNQFNEDGKVSAAGITDEKLEQIHLIRACHIFEAAIANNVKILVLGAFGCGAFRNSPYVVAKAYKSALKLYAKYFDEIEFAVFCGYDDTNYRAFKTLEE